MGLKKALRNKNLKAIIRDSWSISWPMTLIMFFVFLIGLADIYVAGRISKEVQAAYGVATQLYFIFNIVSFALTVGAVAVISRLFTSADTSELRAAVNSSLAVSSLFGIATALLCGVFARTIVHHLGVPEVLKENAAGLLEIYAVSMAFQQVMLNTNGILRACGGIKKSLVSMIVACVLNVVLNFYLAFRTPLGYRGIAVATVISVAVGCALNCFFLRGFVSLAGGIRTSIVRRMIRIGWPSGVLQILWQLGAMVLYVILGALPEHGVETLAAFTNGLKIEAAIFLPAFAFNLSAAVLSGNFLGKKEYGDAFSSGIVTALIGMAIVAVMTVGVMLNAPAIASVLSRNPVVIRECVRYIRIALISEPIMTWAVVLGGSLNGAGDTRSVMMIVGCAIWLVRVPLAYILVVHRGAGASAVWWAMNTSIAVQALLITHRYFSRGWMYRQE